jgi:hypothetical protein
MVAKGLRVNSEAFGRETGEESIAQRSQRGFKIGGERSVGEQRGVWARNRRRKHRTEVTEGD